MTGFYNNLVIFKSCLPFGIYQFNQLLFLYKPNLLKLANTFFFLWCLLLKCLKTYMKPGSLFASFFCACWFFYEQSCHKIIKVAFHHHDKSRVCFSWSFMDIFVLLNCIPMIHDIPDHVWGWGTCGLTCSIFITSNKQRLGKCVSCVLLLFFCFFWLTKYLLVLQVQ